MDFEVIRDATDLPRVANRVAGCGEIALDLETTGLDPLTCAPRLATLNAGGRVYVIDLFETRTLGPVAAAIAACPEVGGHNLPFDEAFTLHHEGLTFQAWDSHVAGQLLYNGLRQPQDLYSVLRRELGEEPRTSDLSGSNWAGPLTDEQYAYAAYDVEPFPRLKAALTAKLGAEGLTRVHRIECDAILPQAAVELRGFPFGKERWLEAVAENEKELSRVRAELLRDLPAPDGQLSFWEATWNLESHQQVLASLRRLGLNLNDTAEATLAECDHPLVDRLIAYRGYAQRAKMFGSGFL